MGYWDSRCHRPPCGLHEIQNNQEASRIKEGLLRSKEQVAAESSLGPKLYRPGKDSGGDRYKAKPVHP